MEVVQGLTKCLFMVKIAHFQSFHMNTPGENYDGESEVEPIIMNDEELTRAFDDLTEGMFDGSPVSCYLDLMLSGAGAPAILRYDKMIYPPAMRPDTESLDAMEELSRRRQLVMDHLLERVLERLKDETGIDSDELAIESLSMEHFEQNSSLIQTYLFANPKIIPVLHGLYVSELGGQLPPKELQHEQDTDPTPPTPEQIREIVLDFLIQIIRKRLKDYIKIHHE